MAVRPLEATASVLRLSREQIQAGRWCPVCRAPTGVIHQRRIRSIRDFTPVSLEQIRFRCKRCGITWTAQPEVVEAGQRRSRALRALGVLLYLAGFSGTAAAFMLCNLGLRVSAATVYRDVQRHRRRLGGRAWERWRRAIREGLVDLRVAPPRPERGAAAPWALILPAGRLTLELAFSCPHCRDSLLQVVSGELLGEPPQ